MRAALLSVMLGAGIASAAWAQVAPGGDVETTIVSAPHVPASVIAAQVHDFIAAFAVPTPATGMIARWDRPVCPVTDGLVPQKNNDLVTERIRKIAREAGARVQEASCKPNIWISFALDPKTLLEEVRRQNPGLLDAGTGRFTPMTHAVQAWYGTATVDIRGNEIPDRPPMADVNVCLACKPDTNFKSLVVNSNGRLRAGLSSEFDRVFIAADLGSIAPVPLEAVADYVAMLALIQVASYDVCQPLPSIVNLLVPDCEPSLKPMAITASDLAYLRGLYGMGAGVSFQVQQSAISGQMEAALSGP